MDKKHNEVAIGIMTLVVLGLTVYIVVTLADWTSLAMVQQEITVRQPYKVGLKGLTQGSPVEIGGVRIGYVIKTWVEKEDLTTIDNNDIYVFFTMKIPAQYSLRNNCELSAESNVLGGESVLSIKDLGSSGDIIADGQTVDVELKEGVIESIRREFDPDNPESFLVRVIKKDIPAITSQIQVTIKKADSALEIAEAALKNLKNIGADERIDRTISNMAEISVNLKLTSEEVRRAPWRLLYKPSTRESKIQSLVDSAGAFAAGAERLDNAASRLHRVTTTRDPRIDRQQIMSMVAELEASFEQFQKAEQKFWNEMD